MSFRERRRYVRAFKAVSTEDPYNRTYDPLTALHPLFFKLIHEKKFFSLGIAGICTHLKIFFAEWTAA